MKDWKFTLEIIAYIIIFILEVVGFCWVVSLFF